MTGKVSNLHRSDDVAQRAHRLLDEQSFSPWFTDYQGRELEFIGDILGLRHARTGKTQLWAAQRAIVDALFKHRFVSVLSARSTGKTFTSGVLIPTFFYTAPSRVLVTGPGMRQITKLSWSEARTRILGATQKLPGELLHSELRIDDRHYAICIPSKNPEHLRGFHAGVTVPGDPDSDSLAPEDLEEMLDGLDDATRMLIIVDEPEAVPAETFRILRGSFNKPNVYCCMTGNPSLGLSSIPTRQPTTKYSTGCPSTWSAPSRWSWRRTRWSPTTRSLCRTSWGSSQGAPHRISPSRGRHSRQAWSHGSATTSRLAPGSAWTSEQAALTPAWRACSTTARSWLKTSGV